MTRKDYEAIAAALRQGRADVTDNPINIRGKNGVAETLDGINIAAMYVADVMARDNPRFDRARFLKAAGVQS